MSSDKQQDETVSPIILASTTFLCKLMYGLLQTSLKPITLRSELVLCTKRKFYDLQGMLFCSERDNSATIHGWLNIAGYAVEAT